MTNNPIFSVVIPTYNRAGFIRKTIESVLVQAFQNFEIIVVDDGSTDNTDAMVKSIQSDKIRYYKTENAERAAARNYGAKIANGEYVNFLDSDDVVYANHLQVAMEFVTRHRGVEIFNLGYDIRDEQNKVLRAVKNIQSVNRQILTGNILSCNSVFIRKDILVANLFNEDRALSALEDWELWLRMSSRYRFLSENIITSTIIQHEERSVMTVDTSKIKRKVACFVHYVLQDEQNKRSFGTGLDKTVASAWTYAALHLSIARENRMEVLRYLLMGIRCNPGELFKKRFLVIIKKLMGL